MTRVRIGVESLESRDVPSGGPPGAFVWDYHGSGVGLTSDPANWVGGLAPPASGAEVVVPDGTGDVDADHLVSVSKLDVAPQWDNDFYSHGLYASHVTIGSGRFEHDGTLVLDGGLVSSASAMAFHALGTASTTFAGAAADVQVDGQGTTVWKISGTMNFAGGTTRIRGVSYEGTGAEHDVVVVLDNTTVVFNGDARFSGVERLSSLGDMQVDRGRHVDVTGVVWAAAGGDVTLRNGAVLSVGGKRTHAYADGTKGDYSVLVTGADSKLHLGGGASRVIAEAGVSVVAGGSLVFGAGDVDLSSLEADPFVDRSTVQGPVTVENSWLQCDAAGNVRAAVTGTLVLRNADVAVTVRWGPNGPQTSDRVAVGGLVFGEGGADLHVTVVGPEPAAGGSFALFASDAKIAGNFDWSTYGLPVVDGTNLNLTAGGP